jgi:hypothetical protein
MHERRQPHEAAGEAGYRFEISFVHEEEFL